MAHPAWTLAHQGGWDEALWFLVPVLVGLIGVRWAVWRANRRRDQDDE